MVDKKDGVIVYQFYDSFFRYLFKNKVYCLELYNALYGSSYVESDRVEIIDLEKVFYNGKRSDLIFRCDNRYILMAEHQSGYCGNMPLRMLIYAAICYEKLFRGKNLYGSSRIEIPSMSLYMFYHGDKAIGDKTYLSDSYPLEVKSSGLFNIEVSVDIVNINYEAGDGLLRRCSALESYSYAVYLVREYQRSGYSKYESVVKAISRCYHEGKLGEFFNLHREEVIKMLLEDNYWEESLRLVAEGAKQEGCEEGKLLGLKEGKLLGREEGKLLGREEGIKDARLDMARMMKLKGYGFDEIVSLTQLERGIIDTL